MADVHNPNLIADDVAGAQFTTPAGSASIGVCAGDPNGVVAGSVGDHVNEEGTTRWWVNVDGGTGWAVPPAVLAAPPAPILRIVGGNVGVEVLEADATAGLWFTGYTRRVPEVLVHDALEPWIGNGLRCELLRRQPKGSRANGQRWTHPSPGVARKWDGGGSNTFIPRTRTEWPVTSVGQVVPVHEFLLDGWFKRGEIKYRAGGFATVDAPIPTRLPRVNPLSTRSAWTSLLQPLRVAFRYSAYDPGSQEWVPGAPTATLLVRPVQSPLRFDHRGTVGAWPERQAELNPGFDPKHFTCSVGGR